MRSGDAPATIKNATTEPTMDRFARQKQEARKAYDQRRQTIDALMEEIRAKLERDARREDITWASVGSLGHVEELLRQITKFLN